MSVIALANTKGGAGKSTLAQCLAYSAAFGKAYKRIALVELDRQGTLNTWHSRRPDDDGTGVDFGVVYSTSPKQAAKMLDGIYQEVDCMVLDLPGESERGIATGFGVAAADTVLIPIRNSTADLDAFGDHLLPALREAKAMEKTYIVPAFTHPATNQAKMREHFRQMMPPQMNTTSNCFPARKVYEYYGEEGDTLREYATRCRKNKREHAQARLAVEDIERLAREVIKYAK
jgi:cellulose biosynthesis protein BcsQ